MHFSKYRFTSIKNIDAATDKAKLLKCPNIIAENLKSNPYVQEQVLKLIDYSLFSMTLCNNINSS